MNLIRVLSRPFNIHEREPYLCDLSPHPPPTPPPTPSKKKKKKKRETPKPTNHPTNQPTNQSEENKTQKQAFNVDLYSDIFGPISLKSLYDDRRY